MKNIEEYSREFKNGTFKNIKDDENSNRKPCDRRDRRMER